MLIVLSYFRSQLMSSITAHGHQFRACFGVLSRVAGIVRLLLQDRTSVKFQPRHILWALLKKKSYHTDFVCAAFFGFNSNKFNKWCRSMITRLSELGQVRD